MKTIVFMLEDKIVVLSIGVDGILNARHYKSILYVQNISCHPINFK